MADPVIYTRLIAPALVRPGAEAIEEGGKAAPEGDETGIPGDGIGLLVTGAVEQVMEGMHAPVYFERYEVHRAMSSWVEDSSWWRCELMLCWLLLVIWSVGGGLGRSENTAPFWTRVWWAIC